MAVQVPRPIADWLDVEGAQPPSGLMMFYTIGGIAILGQFGAGLKGFATHWCRVPSKSDCFDISESTPPSEKVLLYTIGGVPILGTYGSALRGFVTHWCRLPKKPERQLNRRKNGTES